ncbi:MAG: biotin/lipoyl-binding protein, partial [Chloroflexi bacterium]|nr:biotin/lipoyl-binding protein [Chloroflexota bacterium]
IGINFDPLLAKLIVWGADRAEALARMQDALRRYCILGVTTNLPFLLKLVSAPDFAAADLSTRFIPDHPNLTVAEHPADLEQAKAAWQRLRISADPFRHGWRPAASAHRTPDGGLMLDGRRYYVAESEDAMEVWRAGQRAVFPKQKPLSIEHAGRSGSAGTAGDQALKAPMNGMIVKLLVADGDEVVAHQTLLVLEAMKMEHAIQAPQAGKVARLHVKQGQLAKAGETLVEFAAGET